MDFSVLPPPPLFSSSSLSPSPPRPGTPRPGPLRVSLPGEGRCSPSAARTSSPGSPHWLLLVWPAFQLMVFVMALPSTLFHVVFVLNGSNSSHIPNFQRSAEDLGTTISGRTAAPEPLVPSPVSSDTLSSLHSPPPPAASADGSHHCPREEQARGRGSFWPGLLFSLSPSLRPVRSFS